MVMFTKSVGTNWHLKKLSNYCREKLKHQKYLWNLHRARFKKTKQNIKKSYLFDNLALQNLVLCQTSLFTFSLIRNL